MDHLIPPRAIGLIGGGLAALTAAETLRSLGYDGSLHLITAEPHLPYDRPALSKDVLLGTMDPARTQLLGADRAVELDLDLHVGDPAVAMDPDAGTVTLRSGVTLQVDRVLIATGGDARRLSVPGADLAGVATLRTRDDAEAVRDLLQAGGPVVVVGAGFIGLEVAAAARACGCEVTVVEAGERVLGRSLPADIAQYVAERHRATGIEILTGAAVVEIEGDDRVGAVVLADGRRLPASCVIVGIGMVPADDLARTAGVDVSNGIHADVDGRTSHPAVFAAGDVASVRDPESGHWARSEQWQDAQSQAIRAAHAMLGMEPPKPPVPWFWSDQGDVRLQVVGCPEAADDTVLRGAFGDREGWTTLYLAAGAVVGAVAVNRARDVRGASQLIESGSIAPAEALADKNQDLRRVSKVLSAT